MERETRFAEAGVEARGAVCVECLEGVEAGAALLDRRGAALCRACAGEFYAPCAACAGLVPRDEALSREGDGATVCAECFGRGAAPEDEEPPPDEEVSALVADYVALHEEAKRLEKRMDEIKERLKLAARARPRVSNAVVLRAGEGGAAVRCAFASKTTYDPEALARAEELLGEDEFSALFERKVSYAAHKGGRLEEFLSSGDESRAAARELVRAAERRTETATLNVVAKRK